MRGRSSLRRISRKYGRDAIVIWTLFELETRKTSYISRRLIDLNWNGTRVAKCMGVVARWKALDQEDSFVLQKIFLPRPLSLSLSLSLSFFQALHSISTRYKIPRQIDFGTFVSDEQVFAAATNSRATNNSQYRGPIILILKLLMKTRRPMFAWNESSDAARYDASVKKLKKNSIEVCRDKTVATCCCRYWYNIDSNMRPQTVNNLWILFFFRIYRRE